MVRNQVASPHLDQAWKKRNYKDWNRHNALSCGTGHTATQIKGRFISKEVKGLALAKQTTVSSTDTLKSSEKMEEGKC